MKTYTLEQLKAEFMRLGYQWLHFHIIGTRSAADEPNKFDDYIYVVNGDSLTRFQATTNPGKYWLENFNKERGGAAVVKPGQYKDVWALGKHHNEYEALVQVGNITVWRDNDGDLKSEQGKEDTGLFGINMHHANEKFTSVQVDKWSAGCQVIASPVEFATALNLCKASGLKKFTYTLLTEF